MMSQRYGDDLEIINSFGSAISADDFIVLAN
jgi:hypothetical protein